MTSVALPIACRPRRGPGRSALGAAAFTAWLGVSAAARAEPPAQPSQPGGLAVAQPRPAATRWTPTHGERELVFRLSDRTGAPVRAAAADLAVYAAAGVELAPLTATAAGEYRTHLRWPAGLTELTLRVALRAAPDAAVAIDLDPTALEPPPGVPPPGVPPPPAPPRQAAAPVSRPPPGPRVGFELGLAGAALLNRGVYGLGGGLDVGASFRLPFGAISIALRLTLEQHLQPEPAPFLLNFGFVLTYRIGRPRWRVLPYFGLWTQGILQRTPDALGAIALQRSESGLVLGGLGGAQLRLWRGGIFTELGYRGTIYRQTAVAVPAWSTAFLLFGYRLSTN